MLKLPKALLADFTVGVLLTASTCYFGFVYAATRWADSQNAGQSISLGKGPLDVVVSVLVFLSLYAALYLLWTSFLRSRALQNLEPQEERLTLESDGKLFRKFYVTAGPDSKTQERTYRVSPKSRTAITRFDGSAVTGEVYYSKDNKIPLAVSIADEVAFTNLNWNASRLVPRRSAKELVQKYAKGFGIAVVLIGLTLAFVWRDIIWILSMSTAHGKASQTAASSDADLRMQRLLRASTDLDPSDLRRTYGQIVVAAELAKRKQYEKANAVLDQASATASKANEPDVHMAMVATARGSLYKSRGENEKAVEYYKIGEKHWQKCKDRGLTMIRATILGLWSIPLLDVDSQLAEVANRLAILYDDTGNLEEAEKEYQRFADQLKNRDNDFEYYSARLSLERFYVRHEKDDQAVEERITILKDLERKYSKNESDLAAQLERYGGICSQYGDQGCAQVLLERAVAIRRGLVKEKSDTAYLRLAQAMCLLGDAYKWNAEYDKAVPLYKEALPIFKQDSKSSLWTWPELGLAEIELISGDSQAAKAKVENILHTRLREYTATDVRQARPIHVLANYFRRKKDFVRAEEAYRNALSLLENKHSEKNVDLLTLRCDYAQMLIAANRPKEAKEQMNKVNKAKNSAGW